VTFVSPEALANVSEQPAFDDRAAIGPWIDGGSAQALKSSSRLPRWAADASFATGCPLMTAPIVRSRRRASERRTTFVRSSRLLGFASRRLNSTDDQREGFTSCPRLTAQAASANIDAPS
jgi:hypothetical protein